MDRNFSQAAAALLTSAAVPLVSRQSLPWRMISWKSPCFSVDGIWRSSWEQPIRNFPRWYFAYGKVSKLHQIRGVETGRRVSGRNRMWVEM